MKRSIFLSLFFLPVALLAQFTSDAYLYSQEGFTGDARYMSMGGAFSALGGNTYGITNNPAGLAVYLNNSIDFSLGFNVNNSIARTGGNSPELMGKVIVPNFGVVIASRPKGSNWKALNVGYNFNRINDFNKAWRVNYTNPSSSLADYFAEQAIGYTPDFFSPSDYPALPFTSYLAYQAYLINPYPTDSSDIYRTAVGVSPVQQSITVQNRGYVNQSNFSFGANYNNKLYLGVGIGILSSSFSQNISHYEEVEDTSLTLESFTYNSQLNIEGNHSLNASIGVIYRIVPSLRASLHFKTGNIIHLQESYSTDLTTNFKDSLGEIMVLSPEYEPFSYRLRIPPSYGGGLAYVFSKKGVISVEYSQKHIGTANFRPFTGFEATDFEQHADYSEFNSEISQVFTRQHTFKAGAEMKLDNNLAFRIGGRYITHGFKNEFATNISTITSYTAGIGYLVGYWRFDAGAAVTQYTENFVPYSVSFTESPQFEIQHTNVQLSFSVALQF